jgi:hypothetical protein
MHATLEKLFWLDRAQPFRTFSIVVSETLEHTATPIGDKSLEEPARYLIGEPGVLGILEPRSADEPDKEREFTFFRNFASPDEFPDTRIISILLPNYSSATIDVKKIERIEFGV